ncbi:hypothetical protein [Fimbriiglobus ruber]|uniref:hypothetical protein n=1 Tax=Fimbriiglobus ruber TaxID=1908690 RepID=UPI000B4B6795|nr:hypothetical protein [Fimbriiglobus ruber]
MTGKEADCIGLKMPTAEESRQVSENWIAPLRPCLYTQWPEQYRELSFGTKVEVLTASEASELAGIFQDKDDPWSPGLQSKIKRGVSLFTNGCFFRLESRSPKDNYWGEATNFRACSFHDVKKLLYSERILDDLARYSSLESEPVRLLFREWHPIRKSEEFRCFIKNRKLAGISQYHYAGFDECWHENVPLAFAEIYGRQEERKAKISAFIEEKVIPHLHVDDLVVDLWIDHLGKFKLIEINPYGLSDPCLFTYKELENCVGEFRCVQRPKR